MVLADQPAVRQTLRPFEPTIHSVVHGAWDDWKDWSKGSKVFRKRTRANIVHDFMMERAVTALANVSGVNVIHRDQTVKILFGDEVLLRFKKGNSMGLGSNIETNAILDFIDPLAVIPGLPDAQKVEVVYTLNGIETMVHHVSVVARDHNTPLWSYDLGEDGLAVVKELPKTSDLPEAGVELPHGHTAVSEEEN